MRRSTASLVGCESKALIIPAGVSALVLVTDDSNQAGILYCRKRTHADTFGALLNQRSHLKNLIYNCAGLCLIHLFCFLFFAT